MSYQCKIVADSINTFANRITTFLVTFPRFILAEFNTHRVFTRNSASSRAIPFSKMVEAVKTNPFTPIAWMRDHSGMQGTEYFTDPADIEREKQDWLDDRDYAVKKAISRSERGVTKQLVNRPLEPFMWHTALITSTDFENFFALRAHPDAEIHIQKIAYMMLNAYNESTPVQLCEGEWHIPFLDKINQAELKELLNIHGSEDYNEWIKSLLKISTAMCARTSYTIVGAEDKKQDYFNDMKLHDRLATSGHFSPFEHCAKPMTTEEYLKFTRTQPLGFDQPHDLSGDIYCDWDGASHRNVISAEGFDIGVEYGWCGNFRGFTQYRKFLKDENKTDDRVIKKTATLTM